MKNDLIQTKIKTEAIFNKGYLLTIIISLSALVFTFIAASASNRFEIKLYIFSLIIVLYLIIKVGIFHFFKQTYSQKENTNETESGIFNADIEEKLLVLEEVNKFFGASLKSADMIRLVAIRIGQLVEFDTCALFIVNEQSKPKEIISRIEKLFETKSYTFDENTSSKIQLNFGSATFYKDGETANQLLNSAIIKKRDSKVINSGSVLRFLGEYIN